MYMHELYGIADKFNKFNYLNTKSLFVSRPDEEPHGRRRRGGVQGSRGQWRGGPGGGRGETENRGGEETQTREVRG